MRGAWLLGLIVLVLVSGCKGQPARQEVPVTPSPAPRLSARDLRLMLVVRARALEQVEARLAGLPHDLADVPRHIQELRVAEREAAAAVGTDWRRYLWARDRVDQLLTLERQRGDRRLLLTELERTSRELAKQLGLAKDAATREAIRVRMAGIQRQVANLRGEQKLDPIEAEDLKLVAAVRAELADLDTRQEAVQKRVKEALSQAQLSTTQVK